MPPHFGILSLCPIISWALNLFLDFGENFLEIGLITALDYLHITKRFGQVAASQFPLHYLLSMKSVYSPLAMAFQSSHEQLNPWHRLSGKIIYFLLLNHAMWYMNYFFQAGVVYKRLTDVVVIIGIVSFLSITVLATAALETVRRWSYRVFFVLHLFIGFSVLPILFCHTPELRFYTAESLAIFLFDLTFRKLDTVQGLATVTKVADTKLIKLEIPIPPAKLSRYAAAPGQHVYLNIPPESTPSSKSSSFIYSLLYNPFTVADVSSTSVTLVLRTLRGPATQAVNALASLTKANPPVNIEGPYGTSKRFPNLIDKYDRILLVAGGVGATFILPIYRDLRDEMESESISPDRLKLTWAMRSAAEAAWALDLPAKPPLEDDENVKIYFTRNNIDARLDDGTADGSVELQDVQEVGRRMRATGGKERPDLKVLVDEVFRIGNEERVAVLVCGPARMARELRKHVSSWVVKGREVWWHDETLYANSPLSVSLTPPFPSLVPDSNSIRAINHKMLTIVLPVDGSHESMMDCVISIRTGEKDAR